MHHHVIDRHSPTRGLLHHAFRGLKEKRGEAETFRVLGLPSPAGSAHLLVGAEDVQGQRFLSLTDEANGIIHIAHSHNGQQGTKDLLLHHPGVGGHVLQHRRGFKRNARVINHTYRPDVT